jgi:hypothetical protein
LLRCLRIQSFGTLVMMLFASLAVLTAAGMALILSAWKSGLVD